MKNLVTIVILFSGIGLFMQQSHQYKEEQKRIVHAIIGESAGEPFEGQIAIACGIKNRPERLSGVDGLKMTRTPSNSEIKTAQRALKASKDHILCHSLIQGADMWCSNLEICRKSWKNVPMIFINRIGDHWFFRRLTKRSE